MGIVVVEFWQPAFSCNSSILWNY